jgi:NADH-ubiquinone oxidoreductase chain 5
MYLLILYLPLMGSISAGLLGRKIGTSGSQFITIACLAGASCLALLAFYEVALCASPVTINLGSWINSDLLTINWLFLFDSVSVIMLSIVSVVSLFVHIYSIYYMSGEPHQQRFFSFLSLFTFFMLVLVAGGNYLVLFLGWEGIGVSSYLLINYYYTRIASNKAAILAFNQNRVGDWILSVAFFMIIAVFGSLDFDVVFSLAPSINPTLITIICILLFIGAGAKSAVLGLHSWLPGSMEAERNINYILFYSIFILIFALGFYSLEYYTNYCDFIFDKFLIISLPYSFTNPEFYTFMALINPILYPLTGNMLGDGHLGFAHGAKGGFPTGNAMFAMTLKNF